MKVTNGEAYLCSCIPSAAETHPMQVAGYGKGDGID
jgi:hypothetical protein